MEDGCRSQEKMNALLGVFLVLCLLTSPPPTSGQTLQAVPEKPPISAFSNWELHFSLGIVVMQFTKKGVIYFSYPILDQRTDKECKPVSLVGQEIHIREEGIRFVVPYQPTLYRVGNNDWKMWDVRRK